MLSFIKLVNSNRIIYFLAAIILLSSCSEKIKEKLILAPVTLTAEAPYFEGPNSFQGNIGSDVKTFLQEKGYKQEQLRELKIVSASVVLDSMAINMQDLTLQVVSEKESMQKLAYINPLTYENENIQLSVAEEQKNLAPYFLEGGILVLDANFLKEIEQNISFTVSLELELSLEH